MLGHLMVMLVVDTVLYLLIALYVEAIFPGDYGVPQPWYFPFTKSFWCGQPRYVGKNRHINIRTDNQTAFNALTALDELDYFLMCLMF